VADSTLVDLYAAADLYMSFSKWEGYNLGIGQALAFGLPVLASDIPAHREFPVPVVADPQQAAAWLVEQASLPARPRTPRIIPWSGPTRIFAEMLREVVEAPPRAAEGTRARDRAA
jgi:glycosyltransferase involved in cell wall biosynthesis